MCFKIRLVFVLKISLLFFVLTESLFAQTQKCTDLPLCENVYKKRQGNNYNFSPFIFFSLDVPKNIVTYTPFTPKEGQRIKVQVKMPEFLLSFSLPNPEVFLFWRNNEDSEILKKVEMKQEVQITKCRYKQKKRYGFLKLGKRWEEKIKEIKDISYIAEIPPQKKGITVDFFIKAFIKAPIPVEESKLKNERYYLAQAYTLPLLEGLWEDKKIWEENPILNSLEIKGEENEIEKAQAGFDGVYLYFRIKTKNMITPGQCEEGKNLDMKAYGVTINTPEYEPLEKGHGYLIQGWILAYSPCINKIYRAPEVALFESSTFKKGPIKDSGAEYKFFSSNDLVMRISYEKIKPNPSKTILAIFTFGNTKEIKEPIANFQILDGVATLLSLEKYSFTVE